ncbi:unnamed protein product, partial [Polarella glacialis]
EREMDQDEQNRHAQLARVAKAHKDQIKRERKAVKAAKKSGKEEDGRSGKVKNILRGISEAERIAHKSLFDFFDVDKDKTWGSIEFAQRMTDIGLDTSVEAASNILYFAGVRDIDKITYDDFVELLPKMKAFRIVLEKDCMRYFHQKDPYGYNSISTEDLREILHDMAGPDGISHEQVDGMIKKADKENAGHMTFDAVVRALFGTRPLIQYKPPPGKGIIQTIMESFGGFCSSSSGSKPPPRV